MKTLQLLVLVLILPLFGNSQVTSKEKINDLDQYINYLEKHNKLGGSVAIYEKGKELYSRGFGEKTREFYGKNKTMPMFQIGSITKTFTAVLIAQLIEEEKLGLKTTLAEYYPEMPNAKEIRIQQMLNHTSGLLDYVVKEDSLMYWLTEPVSETDILQEIKRQGTCAAPGDSVRYSNSAYYLLAKIVEKERHCTYAQAISKYLKSSVDMPNTFAVSNEEDFSKVIPSYENKNGEWTEIEDFYFLNASGAGDIYSTPTDLNTFLVSLFEGKLISEPTLKSMFPKEEATFGMGLMHIPFYETIGLGHGGDTFGTHSVTAYFQEHKLAISYCINAEDYPTNEFGIGILSILFDKEFEMPKFSSFKADPSLYPSYAGSYNSPDLPIAIKIFEEDGALMAQGDGQPAFVLSPTGEHAFAFLKAGVEITFMPKENKMAFTQGGQAFTMTKE